MKTKSIAADRMPARERKSASAILLALVILVTLSLSVTVTPARAAEHLQAPLCGSGSPPGYGFTYDLLQEHWTVNWQGYVSEQTVVEVDAILDQLNADSIAQTMVLFQDQDQVGIRVNCAVHFLRYMRLGLPAGERKDNGFVFLIVVEPDRIDVHYGVGLGLPALTAPELTAINRLAEEAYASTGSLDQALLTLVREFDAVGRSNYAPLITPSPEPAELQPLVLPSGPLGLLTVCGLVCLGTLIILFLLWAASRLARAGLEFEPYRTDPFGGGFPFDGGGGGSWMRGGGGRGSSRGGGFSSGPSMRGGGGSGRSGRGN
jgi:hypothetical protein